MLHGWSSVVAKGCEVSNEELLTRIASFSAPVRTLTTTTTSIQSMYGTVHQGVKGPIREYPLQPTAVGVRN
jgi:hypothetical protein